MSKQQSGTRQATSREQRVLNEAAVIQRGSDTNTLGISTDDAVRAIQRGNGGAR